MTAFEQAPTPLTEAELGELSAKGVLYTDNRDVTLLVRKRSTSPPAPPTSISRRGGNVTRLLGKESKRAYILQMLR